MLEKADSTANEAQKIIVTLVVLNYYGVLLQRSHCSQSLFSE